MWWILTIILVLGAFFAIWWNNVSHYQERIKVMSVIDDPIKLKEYQKEKEAHKDDWKVNLIIAFLCFFAFAGGIYLIIKINY